MKTKPLDHIPKTLKIGDEVVRTENWYRYDYPTPGRPNRGSKGVVVGYWNRQTPYAKPSNLSSYRVRFSKEEGGRRWCTRSQLVKLPPEPENVP